MIPSAPTEEANSASSGESRHTPTFHRCLGHLRAQNAKKGSDYDPYAVCTASMGYAKSYTKGFRGGARTPGGRDRKIAKGEVKVQHEPRKRGVHWKPDTERVFQQDMAKGRKG